MTITCGIQPTSVVTMAMNVLHNTCNKCIHKLPDTYTLSPQVALRLHHVTTITCVGLQCCTAILQVTVLII